MSDIGEGLPRRRQSQEFAVGDFQVPIRAPITDRATRATVAAWKQVIVACVFFGAVVLLAAQYAFAQEPAPGAALPDVSGSAPVSSFGQALLAILAMLIPAIVGALVWGGKLIAKQIEAHVSNEWGKGALLRLLSEVQALAGLVGTEFQTLILDAKKPTSEGGEAITQGELRLVSQAILAKLAGQYGGWEPLLAILQRIGFGDYPAAAQASLLSHIETAVATKLAADPPGLLPG